MKKQERVARLIDRGPYKTRPNWLAAIASFPIYENFRNMGCGIRKAIRLTRKSAKMASRYHLDYEGAAREYCNALKNLGLKQFAKFLRDEYKEIECPSSILGIKMRSWAYNPKSLAFQGGFQTEFGGGSYCSSNQLRDEDSEVLEDFGYVPDSPDLGRLIEQLR